MTEGHEGLFFDLIRRSKNQAVRVGAALALRNDVFEEGLVCRFLSELLSDPDRELEYAAMLSLATSNELVYLKFQMDPFPTDEILSNIDLMMHLPFQAKMLTPTARVLSRSPYIQNPKAREISRNMRNVSSQDQFLRECFQIIDSAK